MIGSTVQLEDGREATVVKIRYLAQYQPIGQAHWHNWGRSREPGVARRQASQFREDGHAAKVVMRVTAEIVLSLEDSDDE